MGGLTGPSTQIRQATNAKIIIASKSLQGSHSTTTKNAIHIVYYKKNKGVDSAKEEAAQSAYKNKA